MWMLLLLLLFFWWGKWNLLSEAWCKTSQDISSSHKSCNAKPLLFQLIFGALSMWKANENGVQIKSGLLLGRDLSPVIHS